MTFRRSCDHLVLLVSVLRLGPGRASVDRVLRLDVDRKFKRHSNGADTARLWIQLTAECREASSFDRCEHTPPVNFMLLARLVRLVADRRPMH
jgi:hypothetical protein